MNPTKTAGETVSVVDADVHPVPRSADELRSYLAREWRDVQEVFLAGDPLQLYLPTGQPYRRDAVPPGGGAPASDPELTAAQLLDQAGVDYAMLLPLVRSYPNRELEAALCAATNDWLDDIWLTSFDSGGSFWGSISVCIDEPALARAEIERWAGHPRMVQVRINAYSDAPLGHPRYDPIYAAAERQGLPIAVHFGKGSGTSLQTPAGYMPTYFEHHSMYPLNYGAHLVSLIFGGVFERFPDLKWAFVEGGFCWVGPLLWRMDRHWREFRHEVPWLKRRPTEYVLDHVRFTSQPIEEPPEKRQLAKALEWADAEHLLMFSSDYPHWDFDDPGFVIRQLPEGLRSRVFRDNAMAFYGLPERSPVTEGAGR